MINYPNNIQDHQVVTKLREIIDAVNGQSQQLATTAASIQTPLTIDQIKKALTLGGSSPINVTGLLGVLQSAQPSAIIGTHAQRLTTPAVKGTLFIESDRTSIYVGEVVGSAVVWVWTGGAMYGPRSGYPADLGSNDSGFLFYITDYAHIAIWEGGGFRLTDGGGGYFVDSAIALGTGYQLCDGTATDYIANNTTNLAVVTFTTPDETTANPGTYHKSAAAYTGTINAPTAAVITGTTGSTTALNVNSSTGITVTAHPDHIHQDASTITTPDLFTQNLITGTSAQTGIQLTTGGGALTLSHTVVDPTHNHAQVAHSHTVGSLANDTTGQPKNMGVLRYFRR